MRYVTLLYGAKYCKRHFNQYLRNVLPPTKQPKCNEPQDIRTSFIYRTNFYFVPLNKEMLTDNVQQYKVTVNM